MPFHPLPLFCGRNTKNLTFPSSLPFLASVLPRQLFNLSARATSFFPSSLLAQYSHEADGATSSFLVTSSYNWNLRTTGTDRYRLFGRDKSYFFPSTDPNLYFPFVFPLSTPSIAHGLFPLFSFSSRAYVSHVAMNMFHT